MPPMSSPTTFARYDRRQTYRWNYEHAPDPVDVAVPETPGDWRFCGLPVASPLGVPAGPLLCGRWVRERLGGSVRTVGNPNTRTRFSVV